jgi:hypothetical protein
LSKRGCIGLGLRLRGGRGDGGLLGGNARRFGGAFLTDGTGLSR